MSSDRNLLGAMARGVVYPAVEALWTAGFAAAGLARAVSARSGRAGARPEAWRPANGPVAVLAPHPDDETIGCGGAICLHRDGGEAVHVLVLGDGSSSRALDLSPAEMAVRREGELVLATHLLGVSTLETARLSDGVWREDDASVIVAGWLERVRPAVVYAPTAVDFHPDHSRTARALAAALAGRAGHRPAEVRAYQVFVPLGPLVSMVAALGGGVASRKSAALACHASQHRGVVQVARRDRYCARLHRAGGSAEAFAVSSCEQYQVLAAAEDLAPWRGVRPRPLLDPLAWLVGRRARLTLARRTGLRA